MQSSFRMSAVLRGLLPSLLLVGCTAYHPYGRYSGAYPYQQYPNGYQQQIPNGAIIPNNGQLGPSSPLNGSPGPGGAAPGANNGPAATRTIPRTQAKRDTAPFGSGNAVPNYNDPRKIDEPVTPKAGFGTETKPPVKMPDNNVTPFGAGTDNRSVPDSNVQLTNSNQFANSNRTPVGNPPAASESIRFAPPKTIDNDANARPIAAASTANNTAPNPYAYDAKSYSWVRGKVDYDQGTKTWQIMYSLNPPANDQYGGSLTLVDHPRLKDFRNDDVAYIEGEIDTTGGMGKPRYRITKVVHPLAPTGKVEASKIEAPAAAFGGVAPQQQQPAPAPAVQASPFGGAAAKSPF